MASRDDYMKVAKQIAEYCNSFHLAFKTYQVSEFDAMIKVVAGEGARVSTGENSESLKSALLERGFMIFPPISESEDGYVRVIRTGSLVANLLNAFRYVGSNGDTELATLLNQIKRRHRPDDFSAAEVDPV
ncbi:MAG: hypothetical protein P4L99_03180 [Chthoniobacter sp.]|nr:hypothetical protein [Chthoniobacter sp.]